MHTSSAIHREEAKPTPEVGDGAAVKLAHRLPMRCLHDACCQSSAPSQQGFCLAGEEAPLGFSLYYAPPEVVQAYDEGRKTTMSAAAGDVWALGVRRREAPAMRALMPRPMHRLFTTHLRAPAVILTAVCNPWRVHCRRGDPRSVRCVLSWGGSITGSSVVSALCTHAWRKTNYSYQ